MSASVPVCLHQAVLRGTLSAFALLEIGKRSETGDPWEPYRLMDRIAEVERECWLGEVEGLNITSHLIW